MNIFQKKPKFSPKVISLTFAVLVLCFAIGFCIYAAWQEPISAPPQDNVPAPLNVGPEGQIKEGGLMINTGGASTGFVVDKGNVGIGTTTPTVKLDVDGKIKMRSQTADSDSNDTVATKGYVDSKAGGPVAGYDWYDFAFTGGYFKDGENAVMTCSFDIWGTATGMAKIRNGVLYTRVTKTGRYDYATKKYIYKCDSGWKASYTATCTAESNSWATATASSAGVSVNGWQPLNGCIGGEQGSSWAGYTFEGNDWK